MTPHRSHRSPGSWPARAQPRTPRCLGPRAQHAPGRHLPPAHSTHRAATLHARTARTGPPPSTRAQHAPARHLARAHSSRGHRMLPRAGGRAGVSGVRAGERQWRQSGRPPCRQGGRWGGWQPMQAGTRPHAPVQSVAPVLRKRKQAAECSTRAPQAQASSRVLHPCSASASKQQSVAPVIRKRKQAAECSTRDPQAQASSRV